MQENMIALQQMILSIFNKEAIAIFVIFCGMAFAIASIAAVWAFANGEFQDIEFAKFEMLQE
ncbi:MAG: hypothetical protein LW817_03265 [Candidatus Caenarcaniphilales bacterium]|jgi:hypothetical protein|nr:hypothetical protein [Candidatus Caenarcaniphilales bacterium]